MGIAPAIMQGAGMALSAGQAVNSGIKGGRAQRQLNDAQMAQDTQYADMMSTGMGMMEDFQKQASAYHNPALADQVLNMGQNAASGLAMNNFATADALGNQALADQAAGMFGQGWSQSAYNQFAFDPVRQMTGDMVQNALAMGDRARTGAREQLALQSQGVESGLNAGLAARGLSPNSGAAVTALTQNALNAQMQMGNLERGIADMAGNAALQGAQLDTSNQLQLAGMGSQYNLGMNQLMAGMDQARNQYNLNAAQGLAGLQGMRNDVTMQQGALRNAAYTDPLQVMQGIYQQNYLNPSLGMQQGVMGAAQGLLAGALGGQEAGLDRRSAAVQGAASGKGTAMGNAIGFGTDYAKSYSPKGTGTGTGTAPTGSTRTYSGPTYYGTPTNYNPDSYRWTNGHRF